MDQKPGYAQLLRPVGQVLEALHVDSFTLRIEGGDFRVRGKPRSPEAQEGIVDQGIRVAWQILRGRSSKTEEPSDAAPTSGVLEMRYRPEDIERLEQEGRVKRRDPQGEADAHSLSQLLRTVGAFVDQRGVQLLGVSKEDQIVKIEYVAANGQKRVDEFSVSALYDFWVRMFLKRKARLKP